MCTSNSQCFMLACRKIFWAQTHNFFCVNKRAKFVHHFVTLRQPESTRDKDWHDSKAPIARAIDVACCRYGCHDNNAVVRRCHEHHCGAARQANACAQQWEERKCCCRVCFVSGTAMVGPTPLARRGVVRLGHTSGGWTTSVLRR